MALPLTRPSLRRQDFDQVLDALVHDRLAGGEVNRALTKELSKGLKLAQAWVFGAVGDAAQGVLRGLGLRPGDRVVLSPLAAPYWFQALQRLGLVAVWADTTEEAPVIDAAAAVARAQETEARVVVADCCLGFVPDVAALQGAGLTVIEDIGQGLGGVWAGQPVGTRGDAVLMHFAPETLVAGAGGALAGFRHGADREEPGDWELLSDLGASLVLSQWQDRETFAERKREHFRRLFVKLKSYRPPKQPGEGEAVLPWFPLLVESGAKDLLAWARKHAVEADWAFRHQPYLNAETEAGFCPRAKRFLFQTVVFPLYASISERDLGDLGKVLSSLP